VRTQHSPLGGFPHVHHVVEWDKRVGTVRVDPHRSPRGSAHRDELAVVKALSAAQGETHRVPLQHPQGTDSVRRHERWTIGLTGSRRWTLRNCSRSHTECNGAGPSVVQVPSVTRCRVPNPVATSCSSERTSAGGDPLPEADGRTAVVGVDRRPWKAARCSRRSGVGAQPPATARPRWLPGRARARSARWVLALPCRWCDLSPHRSQSHEARSSHDRRSPSPIAAR